MGNSIAQAVTGRHSDNHHGKPPSTDTTWRSYQRQQRQKYSSHHQQDHQQQQQLPQFKSKTLPARSSARRICTHPNNTNATATAKRHSANLSTAASDSTHKSSTAAPPNGETSRVLFLLYLIHRTWNVVVETVDTRSKRSRHSTPPTTTNVSADTSSLPSANNYNFGDANCGPDDGDYSLTNTDFDDVDASSICGSQHSFCSCSYCYDATQNVYNSIAEDYSTNSICERTVSRYGSELSAFYHDYHQMAPSLCQNSPKLATAPMAGSLHNIVVGGGGGGSTPSITQKSHCGSSSINGSMASYKMSSSENSWPQAVFSKENQRPPVYNPEDYAQSLKKFGKRQNGQNLRSIYDPSNVPTAGAEDTLKSSTLPHKHSDYKSPIPAPAENEIEMSLRQFASITDLLTKLRADLRVSFPSFVQEFIATPSDGVSLLLEVLRAIQLSQTTNSPLPNPQLTASMPRNTQSYQRRALLDELACLQCLSICCSRSVEATTRLGTTPIGLMPLASSATGQGIRARILAMQLMSAACDKNTLGHGSQKAVAVGHTAVSDAMSTLRLRCSEPVRFRLLIGMLNSGGGSGELQAVGVKFINSFLESSENLQQRLYLQAELFQAGFEPTTLAKTISSSSPWMEALRNEIKHFHELYVDVDKMLTQARDADRVRNQMVILERRVQILHEEKAVLTSMERRLQERCAELQREIFRLQGVQNGNTFKSLDKQPVALPRHVPPTHSKQDSSEHEDEGISSSETGPSLSPVPILVLPQKSSNAAGPKHKSKLEDKDVDRATIDHVIGELDHVVNEAEKQIKSNKYNVGNKFEVAAKEKEIVPVNIVPQPPRKSRSLAHLVPQQGGGSDLDGSDYGMLLQNQGDATAERVSAMQTFFDEGDYDMPETDKLYTIDTVDIPEVTANVTGYNASTTRELLDVIMNARQSEDDPTIKAFREGGGDCMGPTGTAHNQLQTKRNSHASTDKIKAPAQQFNGVFFMTGMNTPQKYPKPDLTAALQAKRVTKNVERLEAAFASHESLNEAGTRDKSRTNQQIYFGSNPTLRINTSYGSYTNNVTVINEVTTRTRSYTQGSKVTDIPSGLY